jgi:hypothetical protein
LNKTFRKIPRPVTDPGKGSYWIVDYSQGEGNKRVRKRNKKPTKAQLARQAAEADKERQAGQSAGSAAGPSRHSRSGSDDSHSSRGSNFGGLDDSAIDPALSAQGHRVGMQRPTPRNRFRANPPYTSGSNEGSKSPDSRGVHMSTSSVSPGSLGGRQFSTLGDRSSVLAQNQPAFGRSSLVPAAPVVTPAAALSPFSMTINTSTSASPSDLTTVMPTTNTEAASSAGHGFSGYKDSNVSFLQGRTLQPPSRGGRAAASARASSLTFQPRSTSNSSGSEGQGEGRTSNATYLGPN